MQGENRALAQLNSSLIAKYVWLVFRNKMCCLASNMIVRWPPRCHDVRGISYNILTQDHNALSYRTGRLIILPTPSNFSHIYQNNVRFNVRRYKISLMLDVDSMNNEQIPNYIFLLFKLFLDN